MPYWNRCNVNGRNVVVVRYAVRYVTLYRYKITQPAALGNWTDTSRYAQIGRAIYFFICVPSGTLHFVHTVVLCRLSETAWAYYSSFTQPCHSRHLYTCNVHGPYILLWIHSNGRGTCDFCREYYRTQCHVPNSAFVRILLQSTLIKKTMRAVVRVITGNTASRTIYTNEHNKIVVYC